MTKAQQTKIYSAMNETQKERVAEFIAAGLNRNTAISSVVMQDIANSNLPAKLVVYSA